MSASCCAVPSQDTVDPAFRRALWVALIVNAAMCVVEVGASWQSLSVSLLADAIDFFGDSANYVLSLAVLGMAPRIRSKASLVKAACMAAFGVFVLGRAGWVAWQGSTPEPMTMGVIGFIAFAANAGVALMLYRFRTGDSNMQSVWVCSRNDALGNLAVMAAALGVFGTGTAWPDLAVAAFMAALAITGAFSVIRAARAELAAPEVVPEPVANCCAPAAAHPVPVRVAMPVSRKRPREAVEP